jgi:hypothetical protein
MITGGEYLRFVMLRNMGRNVCFVEARVDTQSHNKRVKPNNFKPVSRKGGHRIEHTFVYEMVNTCKML